MWCDSLTGNAIYSSEWFISYRLGGPYSHSVRRMVSYEASYQQKCIQLQWNKQSDTRILKKYLNGVSFGLILNDIQMNFVDIENDYRNASLPIFIVIFIVCSFKYHFLDWWWERRRDTSPTTFLSNSKMVKECKSSYYYGRWS